MLGFACNLDVVRRRKAKLAVKSYQRPFWVGSVIVDFKYCIFREGELLVCLTAIVIECFGMFRGFSLGGATVSTLSTHHQLTRPARCTTAPAEDIPLENQRLTSST